MLRLDLHVVAPCDTLLALGRDDTYAEEREDEYVRTLDGLVFCPGESY